MDTSPDAQEILFECHRRLPPDRRVKLLGDAWRMVGVLHAAGLRAHNPEVSTEEIHRDWTLKTLGKGPWLWRLRLSGQDQPPENQEVIREVVAAFQQEGIGCAVGGTLASSFHGAIRFTQDAELTAEPFPGKEESLVARFRPEDYYVSLDAVQAAVLRRSRFNLIHLATGFKVDVFVRKDRPFDHALWQRRVTSHAFDADGPPVEVVSAEDVILLRLERYRLGGKVSDRHWGDLLEVLRARAGRLDEAYLDRWAESLGVSDLLTRAREEVAGQ